MQSGPTWAGMPGQCLGEGRSSAEIPRQAFSGAALSPGQMVRSLVGDASSDIMLRQFLMLWPLLLFYIARQYTALHPQLITWTL